MTCSKSLCWILYTPVAMKWKGKFLQVGTLAVNHYHVHFFFFFFLRVYDTLIRGGSSRAGIVTKSHDAGAGHHSIIWDDPMIQSLLQFLLSVREESELMKFSSPLVIIRYINNTSVLNIKKYQVTFWTRLLFILGWVLIITQIMKSKTSSKLCFFIGCYLVTFK